MPLILDDIVLPPYCWDNPQQAATFVRRVKAGVTLPYVPPVLNTLRAHSTKPIPLSPEELERERRASKSLELYRKLQTEILLEERVHHMTTAPPPPCVHGSVDDHPRALDCIDLVKLMERNPGFIPYHAWREQP